MTDFGSRKAEIDIWLLGNDGEPNHLSRTRPRGVVGKRNNHQHHLDPLFLLPLLSLNGDCHSSMNHFIWNHASLRWSLWLTELISFNDDAVWNHQNIERNVCYVLLFLFYEIKFIVKNNDTTYFIVVNK